MEDNIRIIEVKRSIFADNDADADRLRQLCSHEQRTCEHRTAGRTGALQRLYAGFKGECTAR